MTLASAKRVEYGEKMSDKERDPETTTRKKGPFRRWTATSAAEEVENKLPDEERGFHGPSPFSRLPYWNAAIMNVTDVMHIVGNNIERLFLAIIGHDKHKYTKASKAVDERLGHLSDGPNPINKRATPPWVVNKAKLLLMDADLTSLRMPTSYGPLMPVSAQGTSL